MTERSVEHATFVIERVYDASPARVFNAWAEPAARRRWFLEGTGWDRSSHEQDFRVGGRETGSFAKDGGPTYRNDTVYLDIVPDRRIVFAYTMASDDTPISASLATVELRPAGSGSRLVFTEQGAFLDGGDQPRYREEGWTSLLSALAGELRQEPGAAAAS